MTLFARRNPDDLLRANQDPVDATVFPRAQHIVESVRRDGEPALRSFAEELDSLAPDQDLLLDRTALRAALDALPTGDRRALELMIERVRAFATAQRACFTDLRQTVQDGVEVGHTLVPLQRAGAYVPGGRYPLPSTVVMTVVPARVAGVEEVWVASPRPSPHVLAAAALCDADGVLRVGGAQAIAALAFGVGGIGPCDAVVGPGNAWVTAAKACVSRYVHIDSLAGPSELVVLADRTAPTAWIAADLLAQAEHDVQARPILVTTSSELALDVQREVAAQLETLPTRDVARAALANGGWVLVDSVADGVALCNRLAPEHLQLMVEDPDAWKTSLRSYGTLFLGSSAAEVLGDYGVGPNHVLPTGGSARRSAGLSVLDFLRARTWVRAASPPVPLLENAAVLARAERLEGHARAAELRIPRRGGSKAPSRA